MDDTPIAIIGLDARFPGDGDTAEVLRLFAGGPLSAQRDTPREIQCRRVLASGRQQKRRCKSPARGKTFDNGLPLDQGRVAFRLSLNYD